MKRRAIRKVDINLTWQLNEGTSLYDARIKQYVQDRQAQGWQLYVAHQTHGWCCWATKQIVIPTFAAKRTNIGYRTWYLAHELAHSYASFADHHGPVFMAQLKRICPDEFQVHEFGYKPSLAMAAGLSISRELLF